MNDNDDVQNLNLADLDVEALERRLEMVQPAPGDEGYYCGTDCGTFSQPIQPEAE